MRRYSPLVTLVLLAGCGGGLTLDNYGAAAATSICGKIFECCSETEIEAMDDSFISFTTEQECEDAYNTMAELSKAIFKSAEEEGRLSFDGVAAQDCLDSMTASSCDDYRDGTVDASSECQDPFTPMVEAGGDCASDLECIGGGECDGGSTFGPATGTCVGLPDIGEDCDFDCVAGAYCDFFGDEVCVAYAKLNEDCSDASCEEGTFCEYDSGTAESRCATAPALGEDCTSYCARGSFCDDDTDKCVAQLANGEDCMGYDECVGGWCEGYDGTNAGVCESNGSSGFGACG